MLDRAAEDLNYQKKAGPILLELRDTQHGFKRTLLTDGPGSKLRALALASLLILPLVLQQVEKKNQMFTLILLFTCS